MINMSFCKKINISGLGCIREIHPTIAVQNVPLQDIDAQR